MTKALKLSPLESLYRSKPYYATEKLRVRCKEVGVEPPTGQPIDNNVVVWRLPPLKVSAGGIVLPEEAQSPHVKGILMAMGPRARDVLYSNGIEEGDVVTWARFAGSEYADKTATRSLRTEFLTLKDRDILWSDDLRESLAAGKIKYVQDAGGRWCLQRKLLNGRKEKLLALAASTTSPAEAETARRLAANEK
jgi:co-chaperonin GroES (HSP10)